VPTSAPTPLNHACGTIEIALPGGVSVRVDARVESGAAPSPGGVGEPMITRPTGARVYLACSYRDMRKGMQGLAMLVQRALAENPFDRGVYAFRRRRANLLKLIGHDGIGPCMLTKRSERGQFIFAVNLQAGAVDQQMQRLVALNPLRRGYFPPHSRDLDRFWARRLHLSLDCDASGLWSVVGEIVRDRVW
jgi:transposase